MSSLPIFKLFTKDKSVWDKYKQVVSQMAWEKETQKIISAISRYYKKFPENNFISKDEFVAFFNVENQGIKDKGLYLDLIDKVYDLDTSREVASEVISQLIIRDFSNKIANATLPVLAGTATPEDFSFIEDILVEYQEFKNPDLEEEQEFATNDLDTLLDEIGTDGLSWRLKCLNDSLGPLVGGTLGHLFARPETGKTTFLHSEVSYVISQLGEDECVLWLNNEESAKRITLRWYTAVTGLTRREIEADIPKAKALFKKRDGGKMHLKDDANFTVHQIEQLCLKYKPRLVVIDQGDKVSYKGDGKAGNGADRLKGVYDKLREVVKRCNKEFKMDMLTIGQADVACEGKKWLFLSNLDSGKTGKAGAFDYVIGIGKTFTEANRRYISLCKNKLESGDDIGEKFVCEFDNVRARYTD